MSRRVLVTGGSGFIGSHVVDKLAAGGFEPVIFDVAESPWPEHVGVATIKGSILDANAVRQAATGCEAIVHLAASADVGIVEREPAEAEALNSRGTFNVLEAARATDARVVYASTIWVYSDTPGEVLDENSPLLAPAHFYSATKLAGEHYCRSYRELFGVTSTVLRFGIPYGPRARPAAVLPIFVNKALAGEALTIAGDGKQTRRFVYVEDLADGVVSAVGADAAAGRTYNLVGEEETSVRDIADVVCAIVGDVSVVHTVGRSGDFAGAVISGDRARDELGWAPQTRFADGVRRYVDWHVAQPATPVAATTARPERTPLLSAQIARRVPLTAAFAVLLAYLIALAALGISGAELGTAAAASVLLAIVLDTRELASSRRGLAFGTLAGLVLLAIPPLAHAAEIAPLNVQLLVVSAVGAVGALGTAVAVDTAVEQPALQRS
jgi:UDP-glucose 4-epimerase